MRKERNGREKKKEKRGDARPRGLNSSLYLVLASFRRRPSLIHNQVVP